MADLWWKAVLAVIGLAGVPLVAGEHPSGHTAEHPSAPSSAPSSGQRPAAAPAEHPSTAPTEHPATPSGAHLGTPQLEQVSAPPLKGQGSLPDQFSKAVKRYVRNSSKPTGYFVLEDEILKKPWKLKLVRFHEDKIVRLGPGKFFVCADFKEPLGKNTVDLDFYAHKGIEGWSVDEVLIHKLNGEPRFTYNEKNQRVPVK